MSNIVKTVLAVSRQPVRNMVVQKRSISSTLTRSEKPSVSVSSETSANHAATSSVGTLTHIVKPYHKYALVWTGKYKSLADVPERVAHGVLDTALNKARIKIAIYMMIATAIMAGAAVYSGKAAVARGENLAIQGIEYHKQLREQAAKEKEAAAAAAKTSQ